MIKELKVGGELGGSEKGKTLPGFQVVEKKDAAGKVTHSVTGIATSDTVDKDREIADYQGTLAQIKLWSEDAVKKTTGNGQELSLGNIRVQHDPKQIGGKVTAVEPNADRKQISIDTQPLDDVYDKLILPGMVKGFSIAGSYKSRECNTCSHEIERGHYCGNCKKDVIVRYVPAISEISYVDNPCNDDCSFTYVKLDGGIEIRKFANVKKDPVASAVPKCGCSCVNCAAGKCKECTMPGCDCGGEKSVASDSLTKTIENVLVRAGLMKQSKTKRVAGEDLGAECFAYVGDKDDTSTWKLPYKGFSTEEKNKSHVRNALARFSQTQGIPAEAKSKVKAKLVAAAKKHGIEVSDKSKCAVTGALRRILAEQSEEQGAAKYDEAAIEKMVAGGYDILDKVAPETELFKGMYTVGSLANIMQDLQWIVASTEYERDYEGDESEVPDDLRSVLQSLVPVFVAMAQEEASELLAQSKKAANGGKGGKSMDNQDPALLKAAKEKLAELWKKAKSIFHKIAKAHEGCAKAMHKAAGHHEDMADHHATAAEGCADKTVTAELQKLDEGADFKKLAKVDQIFAKAEVLEKAKGLAGHFGKMAKAHANIAKCMTKAAGHHEDMDKAAVDVGNAEEAPDMQGRSKDDKDAEGGGSSEKTAAQKEAEAAELKKSQEAAEEARKTAEKSGANADLVKAITAGNEALAKQFTQGLETISGEVKKVAEDLAKVKKDVDENLSQLEDGPEAAAKRAAAKLAKDGKHGDDKNVLEMPKAEKSSVGVFAAL